MTLQTGCQREKFTRIMLAGSIFALFSVVVALRLRRQSKEYDVLLQQSKRLFCSEGAASNIKFSSDSARRLWDFMLLVAHSRLSPSQEMQTEVLTLTESLVAAADQKNLTAEKLENILMGLSSDIVASGIILQNRQSGDFRLERAAGVSEPRLREPLLTLFDSLRERERWGYIQDSVTFNLFGIGHSLVVPLHGKRGVAGGVWLGFRKGASTLSAERRELLNAVVMHAAASFYTAEIVQERYSESRKERDIILGMSHDLRSPGNTALYSVRAMLDGVTGELDEHQRKELKAVERSLEAQLGILGDLFDFTKHQNGSLKAQKSEFLLSSLLTSLIEDFSPLTEAAGLELRIDPCPEVPVLFDRQHLSRIMRNLVSNAIKYTERGSVSVSYELQENVVRIHVRDTGIGVPHPEQLFKSFHRMANTGARQGLGLGLSMSKLLAEVNGGSIEYRPNGSQGSLFTLGIPRGVYPSDESRSRSLRIQCQSAVTQSRPSANVPHRKVRILVADDDPGVTHTFSRYLRDLHATIVTSNSVSETIEKLKNESIDLLVTDMQYEDGTVLDIFDSGAVECPALICTGSSETSTLLNRYPLPHIASLEKPIDRATLLSHIDALLCDS